MTAWQAALLGLLQGVTEFLPVSSSGHLALAQMLIPGFEQPGVVFDAILHVGTALAVVWYERRQLRHWFGSIEGRRLIGLLVLGTFATAAVALPLRHVAERAFTMPIWVGLFLILTGVIVGSTRFLSGGGRGEASTTWRQAAVMGAAQGLAIFPGLSRSGLTIATGLGAGLERGWVARFSFLLSVPAIAGATLAQLVEARADLATVGAGFWLACLLGAAAAGGSGYLALRIVIRTVTSSLFHRFAWYCVPLGLVVLVVMMVGGGS
ncbi:MAG: undecaprenyl-diphosphate phosphatase [Thermoanaerobaculales bacterium]